MIPEVAGIVLAAGEGRRFGKPKALVEFGGQHLGERAVATLTGGGCQPVVVVLGARAPEVREALAFGSVVVVVNDAWADGMGGSLRAGLAEAQKCGASAALVMQVDQPFVTPALVHRLIDAWRDGAIAAVASYGGKGRTPVVLDGSIFSAVADRAVGDVGARAYLGSNPSLVTLVDCDDVGDPADIDTEADLAALEQRWRSRSGHIFSE